MAIEDRIVITIMGRDKPGIISRVTSLLADYEVNILDLTQSIMRDMFAMMILVDISKSPADVTLIQNKMDELSQEMGIKIMAQHENVFKFMHRI